MATRRELIDRALKGVEAWEQRWGAVPASPAAQPDVDVVALLEDYAGRMDATLPFFHPRYAGQMLKPPHPVAVAAYLAAMIVNPNNHALDASQATSPMEVVYSLRSCEPSNVDVSEIAASMGGGGHKRAAGFQLDHILPSD